MLRGEDDVQEVMSWFDLQLAPVYPHFVLNLVVYRHQTRHHNDQMQNITPLWALLPACIAGSNLQDLCF